ncbi:hypothetical protein BDZ90DRAFT_282013 [Jaminaea rosea]|uniref:Uncharacterized protein n=1 Tax=Jaminaea rosea TaxID=1569628 RepID=A0A316UHF1_9BASI|nr:hypothetical protein BDZ90DRAFT_282013 [Jaminaea rosea]PWN24669.1 hypothetical protein BDZ90DRAFT_282013 [Jaminaea rosea]
MAVEGIDKFSVTSSLFTQRPFASAGPSRSSAATSSAFQATLSTTASRSMSGSALCQSTHSSDDDDDPTTRRTTTTMTPSSQKPGARHGLDLLKRVVYRLAEPSLEERVGIWRQMRRGFEGHVVDGCLQVVLSPSLPLLEVKLGVPFADGPARLKLLGRPDTKLPPQPRSATPEASFMIRHYQVVVENMTVQRAMQNWHKVEGEWSFVLTRGPEGLGVEAMAAWLVRVCGPLELEDGYTLKDFGCRLCLTGEDRCRYLIRMVEAYHEHIGCAFFRCVASARNYPSTNLFNGAWFDHRELEGGNSAPPAVPFKTLHGSLAKRQDRRALQQQQPSKHKEAVIYEELMKEALIEPAPEEEPIFNFLPSRVRPPAPRIEDGLTLSVDGVFNETCVLAPPIRQPGVVEQRFWQVVRRHPYGSSEPSQPEQAAAQSVGEEAASSSVLRMPPPAHPQQTRPAAFRRPQAPSTTIFYPPSSPPPPPHHQGVGSVRDQAPWSNMFRRSDRVVSPAASRELSETSAGSGTRGASSAARRSSSPGPMAAAASLSQGLNFGRDAGAQPGSQLLRDADIFAVSQLNREQLAREQRERLEREVEEEMAKSAAEEARRHCEEPASGGGASCGGGEGTR